MDYTILDVEQRSNNWHALRSVSIGGSDAPVIMGASPWMTIDGLLQEKVGLGKDRFVSSAMQWGIDNEDIARQAVSMCTNIDFTPKVIQNKKYPWMIASLDGLSDCGTIALEVKCLRSTSPDYDRCMAGEVPKKYWIQCQHIMMCGGFDKMFFFTFGEENYKLLVLHKDIDFCDLLLNKEIEFLEKINDTKKSNAVSNQKETDFFHWNVIADTYKQVHQEVKFLEKEIQEKKKHLDELKNSLINLSYGDSFSHNGISLTKVNQKGAVKWDEIPELLLVDLDRYRMPEKIYYTVRVSDNGTTLSRADSF